MISAVNHRSASHCGNFEDEYFRKELAHGIILRPVSEKVSENSPKFDH